MPEKLEQVAKVFYGQTAGADMSQSPTLTDQMTRPEVILAAPENLRRAQMRVERAD